MSEPLQSSRHKLRWADRQIQDLNDRIAAYLATDAYLIAHYCEIEGGEQVSRVVINEEPWPEIGLRVGDAIHNLRSCLDNAIYDLAKVVLRTSKPPRDIAFPVAYSEAEFAKAVGDCLPGFPQEIIEVIEGLQPYKVPYPRRHELRLINRLSNIDKHETMHIAAVAVDPPARIWFTYGGLQGSYVDLGERYFKEGPLSDGDELLRGRVNLGEADNMKVLIPREIGFGRGSPASGLPVGWTMLKLRRFVRHEVLSALAPFAGVPPYF